MEVVEGRATVEDVDVFLDTLADFAAAHDATIQAFDARYIVDREHLERAVELAARADERGERIAREFAVEILLYAAGRRQINRAVEIGLSEGEGPVAVVVVGGDENGAVQAIEAVLEPASVLGEYDPALVQSIFDIGERELAAAADDLAALVHERVAMLVVDR